MNKRIIVKINGGVGNQLFQYAFGRCQSLRDSRALILDKLSYNLKAERMLGREFALDQFHIAVAEPSAVDAIYIRAINTRFLGRLIRSMSASYVREETFEQDAHKLSHARSYVTGYWQSYKYFDDHRHLILADLAFKTKIDHEPLAQMILSTGDNAVMLHIRRGDYLTDANHHLLDMEYYQRAMRYLQQKYIGDLTVFVFTDDPEWAQHNVHFNGVKVVIAAKFRVDPNHDLQLMTMCNHHVLANSSYSWWSRYLSKGVGVCIAPRAWLTSENDPKLEGMLLPQWIRL